MCDVTNQAASQLSQGRKAKIHWYFCTLIEVERDVPANLAEGCVTLHPGGRLPIRQRQRNATHRGQMLSKYRER